VEWAVVHPIAMILYNGNSIDIGSIAMFFGLGSAPMSFPQKTALLAKNIGFGAVYDPNYDLNIFRDMPSDVIAAESTCSPDAECKEISGYMYVTSNGTRWMYTAKNVISKMSPYTQNGELLNLTTVEYNNWESEFLGHVMVFD
jgi:hypothetical protein